MKNDIVIREHTTHIRVRYAETDAMKVVYNGVYLTYFEVGRAEAMRAFGLSYKQMEEEGYLLPLRQAGITYYLPAVYDDVLQVTARCHKPEGALLRIEYEIKREGNLLVTGFTEHIFARADNFKPVRPPKHIIEQIFTPKD